MSGGVYPEVILTLSPTTGDLIGLPGFNEFTHDDPAWAQRRIASGLTAIVFCVGVLPVLTAAKMAAAAAALGHLL